jgi:hypothetical protein
VLAIVFDPDFAPKRSCLRRKESTCHCAVAVSIVR